MTNKIEKEEVEGMLRDLPEQVAQLRQANRPIHIDQLFSGDDMETVRESIKSRGVAQMATAKGSAEISAMVDSDGFVWSLAAAIPRRPGPAMGSIRADADYSANNSTEDHTQLVPTWHQIYKTEGIVNNAINKGSALVSSDGNFYVRRARQRNRKVRGVEEELALILDYWKKHVNASMQGAITSARGLSAIVNQGSRQAMIEGSWIGYMTDKQVEVPSLGKSYTLPIYIQTLSTQFITIPDELVGTGLEQFVWEPPQTVINAIVEQDPSDDRLADMFKTAFDNDMASELEEYGNLMLDPQRVMHVKHRGVDTEPFGESYIQPLIGDLAYKRSLQSLDLVTIDSIVNRILIIKVGSDDPKSEYHNLEFAQKRLVALRRLIGSDAGPNMTLLWAGPDIEVIDVGVHNKLAEIDGRYEVAKDRLLLAMGIPEALLVGHAAGQVWAGYEGYKETLRAIQNSFAQAMIAVGERIAGQNGFEGVELHFEFDRTLLADQSKNADLTLRAQKAGIYSIRKTIHSLGGDFETERRNKLIEMGVQDPDSDNVPDDLKIFSPPMGFPGDTRVTPDGNLRDPGAEPGRPPDSEREDISPERDTERR